MDHVNESPKWWRYFARFLLIVTIGAVFIFFISIWTFKSSDLANIVVGIGIGKGIGIFGNDPLGQAMVIAVINILLFYAILSLLIVSVIGVLLGLYLKLPLKDFVIVFVVSLVSILYIMT